MRGTRKLMAVAASCVLAVSLAACGGGDEEPAAEDVTLRGPQTPSMWK